MPFDNFNIIESTLREGEQFSTATFTTEEKAEVASLLDSFGVEFIEMTSPLASPQSAADIRRIVGLGLKARILTHIRCNIEDAKQALDTGVHGLDIVIGTSPHLMQHSHGKSILEIVEMAEAVLRFVREQSPTTILRFSTEDSFRSRKADLFTVYLALAALEHQGKPLVNRFGVADTVGVATPMQVYRVVGQLVEMTGRDIEFHGHNDSGCAVANASAALEAGATHVDVTVLGIGERNGITSLSGLIARLYTIDRRFVLKYDLKKLPEIDRFIARLCQIDIPFSNPITGESAFMHKAGIHAKAVLADPETYEIIKPEDFGLQRQVPIGHKLTGWNAVMRRSKELGLSLDRATLQSVTNEIKRQADHHPLTLDEVDEMLAKAAEQSLVSES